MKTKFKKAIALLAAAALVLPTFGCSTDGKQSKDEEVTLKWVMVGPGKQKDSQMVWDKFNEKLQEHMPGVTVDFQILNGSEYNQQWQLMMSAQEEVDLVWTGYAISSFSEEVNKGAYLELDELLEKYGQGIKSELEPWVFEYGKVNGKIYAVPCYQRMSTSPIGLRTPKALSDKYLDVEKLKTTFNEWETNPAKGDEFYAMLTDYLQKLKDNGELGTGVGVGTVGMFEPSQKIDGTTVSGFSIDTRTMKVFYNAEGEYAKKWYEMAAQWYKKGFIRSDVLSVKGLSTNEVKDGYIMWQHAYDDNRAALESVQHGFDIEVIPLGDEYVVQNSVPSTATCIARTSKHPETAMKLMNFMNSKEGSELYNLLTYGIEGVHYDKIGENRIKAKDYVQQGEENSAYGLWKWAIGNTLNAMELEADTPGWNDYWKGLDTNATVLPTLGFKPDVSEISNQLANISAAGAEFSSTLRYGAAGDDWENIYNQMMEKVNLAGVQEVKENLQKQLDEWLAAKEG